MAGSIWLSLVRAAWATVLDDEAAVAPATATASDTDNTMPATPRTPAAVSMGGGSDSDSEYLPAASSAILRTPQPSHSQKFVSQTLPASTTRPARRFHVRENEVRDLRTSLRLLRPSVTLAVCYMSCLWLREPLLCNDLVLYVTSCLFYVPFIMDAVR